MGSYIYVHALRDFLRFTRLIAWVLACGFVAMLGVLWPHIVRNEAPRQMYADLSSMLIFHMVALASAILTTSIIGQEVEQKTIVYLLTRPVSRWLLLLMRYLASATVVSFIGILACVILSAVMFHGNPFANDLLTHDAIAIILGAFAYGGLFLLVSLLIVRPMILCVLFAFVWEYSVPNLPGDLYHLSVFSYMQAVAEHPVAQVNKGEAFLAGDMGNNMISASTGYPAMVIITVVLVLVSLWWFTRFEYVPREDAD